MNMKRNQLGSSLFETVAVLTIGAVLTAGAFSAYSSVVTKAKSVSQTYSIKEISSPRVVFGPYSVEQFFPEPNNNAYIYLGDECMDDFSCRRSFCGEIEFKSSREIYVHLKSLDYCIKNLADY